MSIAPPPAPPAVVHHARETTEDGMASALGDVLLATRAIGRLRAAGHALGPHAGRAVIGFDVHHGRGQLTGIDLLDHSGNPLCGDRTEELLESPALPHHPRTIGQLLDDGIFGILRSRHPGWENDPACTGTFGVDWSDPGGPEPLPRIAIHIHLHGQEHCATW